MNSQIIQKPIKFSIKTHNLDDIRKQMNKSFIKESSDKINNKLSHSSDIVNNMNQKNDSKTLEYNNSRNLSILGGSPVIKKSDFNEYCKRDALLKRSIDENSDYMSKLRKFDDSGNKVIIESEMSPLPKCEKSSDIVMNQELIIQPKITEKINMKAIFKTLEEKINNIDKICNINPLFQSNESTKQVSLIDHQSQNFNFEKETDSSFPKIRLKMQSKKLIVENNEIFGDRPESEDHKIMEHNNIKSKLVDERLKALKQSVQEANLNVEKKRLLKKNSLDNKVFRRNSPEKYKYLKLDKKKYERKDVNQYVNRDSKKNRSNHHSKYENETRLSQYSRSQDQNRYKSSTEKLNKHKHWSPETKLSYKTLGETVKSHKSPFVKCRTSDINKKNLELIVGLSEQVLEESFPSSKSEKTSLKDKSKISENIKKLLNKKNSEVMKSKNEDLLDNYQNNFIHNSNDLILNEFSTHAESSYLEKSASEDNKKEINSMQQEQNLGLVNSEHFSHISISSPLIIHDSDKMSLIDSFPMACKEIIPHTPSLGAFHFMCQSDNFQKPKDELDYPITSTSPILIFERETIEKPFVKFSNISFKISPMKMQTSNVFSHANETVNSTQKLFTESKQMVNDDMKEIVFNQSSDVDISDSQLNIIPNLSEININENQSSPTFKVPLYVDKKWKKNSIEKKTVKNDEIKIVNKILENSERLKIDKSHSPESKSLKTSYNNQNKVNNDKFQNIVEVIEPFNKVNTSNEIQSCSNVNLNASLNFPKNVMKFVELDKINNDDFIANQKLNSPDTIDLKSKKSILENVRRDNQNNNISSLLKSETQYNKKDFSRSINSSFRRHSENRLTPESQWKHTCSRKRSPSSHKSIDLSVKIIHSKDNYSTSKKHSFDNSRSNSRDDIKHSRNNSYHRHRSRDYLRDRDHRKRNSESVNDFKNRSMSEKRSRDKSDNVRYSRHELTYHKHSDKYSDSRKRSEARISSRRYLNYKSSGFKNSLSKTYTKNNLSIINDSRKYNNHRRYSKSISKSNKHWHDNNLSPQNRITKDSSSESCSTDCSTSTQSSSSEHVFKSDIKSNVVKDTMKSSTKDNYILMKQSKGNRSSKSLSLEKSLEKSLKSDNISGPILKSNSCEDASPGNSSSVQEVKQLKNCSENLYTLNDKTDIQETKTSILSINNKIIDQISEENVTTANETIDQNKIEVLPHLSIDMTKVSCADESIKSSSSIDMLEKNIITNVKDFHNGNYIVNETLQKRNYDGLLTQFVNNVTTFVEKSDANLNQLISCPVLCNQMVGSSYGHNQLNCYNINQPNTILNPIGPASTVMISNAYNNLDHNNYSLNVFQPNNGIRYQNSFNNFLFVNNEYNNSFRFMSNEQMYNQPMAIPIVQPLFANKNIQYESTVNCNQLEYSYFDKSNQFQSEPIKDNSYSPLNYHNLTQNSVSKKSSTSSMMNETMDMDIASESCRSADSRHAINVNDELSEKDDLSSCGEFEFENTPPLDPFEKFPLAPKPQYEHIIETEVHVSAYGKRFEYAYLKSTVCNCVPPNPDEIKQGKTACDETCFNRRIKVECNHKCPVYELCTNRRFQEHIYTPFEPFYCVDEKGWGIRSLNKVYPGTFIIEYVGELIDFHEFLNRIRQKSEYNHHFIMAIQKDMYIDAGKKGNWSRFVNHSCDPNTVIERWVVNGKTRIGFFAKKLINENEEITIDYQFQQYGMVEQKCYCYSSNCTGIMGKVNEKLQEQIKTSHIRLRKELIQKITSRISLKDISHVSDMITIIKEDGLDRDTFYSFLEVLLRTDSEVCIRTFIECGGLKIITSYLDNVQWNDWSLKLLYLQCLDHFKLKKRIILSSGCTAIKVVEYWSENPRYILQHYAEEESITEITEQTKIGEQSIPFDRSTEIKFTLHDSDFPVEDVENEIKTLAIDIKQYFANEKEKFYIPKLKMICSDSLAELSLNDSESKSKDSASRASSVQRNYVKSKKRKIRRKCTEAIRKLSKEEFRRLFSERHEKLQMEKNQIISSENANNHPNFDSNTSEVFQVVKKLLSSVIIDEITRLKNSDNFIIMPIEFQNLDLDKILSDLNIVGQEEILSLLQQSSDENKNSSASTHSNASSKSQDDNTSKLDLSITASKVPELPPNWHSRRSENGRLYYYNIITKKTQWDIPIYPWDAGEEDPMAYNFGNASQFQVTQEDVHIMYEEYKKIYKQQKIEERRRSRLERSIQRKLNMTAGERNKIEFSKAVFRAVKAIVKPYNNSSCKVGRIQHKQDLKFLCEKFANTIITKEVKLVANLEDLEINANVRAKIKTYIEKYMGNQGRIFKRSLKHKLKSKQFLVKDQSLENSIMNNSQTTESRKHISTNVNDSPDFSP